jgi:hypothetical protein
MDHLKTMNKVPHEIETKILFVLQTSSVDAFNSVFKMLADTRFLSFSVNKSA